MKTKCAVMTLALIASAMLGGRLWSGGNLQEGWLPPFGFNNSYWDERLQPVAWNLFPATEAGFSEQRVVPIVEQAMAAWGQFEFVDGPDFFYDGLSFVPVESFNGLNTIAFGDLDRITGIAGAIASAPCAILAKAQEVEELSNNVTDGMGFLFTGDNPQAPRLTVPIGYYQQGVILECEMLFNVIEHEFSDDFSPGTHDLLGVTTHELGHWLGLAHTPIPDATMYKVVTTNPPADGELGQRSLEFDDLGALAHIYKTDGFDDLHGTISGTVTIDGHPGDGVHVTALDARDLNPVAGRFSMSWAFNEDDRFDGDDRVQYGTGFYRLDGLPPGDYYVYAEWYDGTDERIGGRLDRAPNVAIAVSNVATGYWPYWGELDFLPQRFEFHNTLESADGGDGDTPGLSADNPDEARLIRVDAGQVVEGIDIRINLDPDIAKPKLVRSDPTAIGRHDLTPITDLRAGAVISTQGNGDDDYFVLRFPAAELPEPPYNVLEGIWTKWGRADRPYVGGLMLGDPDQPEVIEPAIVFSTSRFVVGWGDGNTGNPRLMDVRERFNVTINQPRDLYFLIQQPETPPEARFFSEGWFVVLNRTEPGGTTGKTLVTRDGFDSFFTSESHDVVYRVRTEKAPPVMVTRADPATIIAGQHDLVVTIHGAGFREGATVKFLAPRFGEPGVSGVEAGEVRWVDSSTLEVDVNAAASAPIGLLDVQVSNPEVVIPNRARLMSVEPDTAPPVIHGVTASPGVLWPPDHRMVTVVVEPSVTDAVDSSPACSIVSVSSDAAGETGGDDGASPDWEITGDLTVSLRAERAGRDRGREYTITFSCSDAAGNSARGSVVVAVPHDRRRSAIRG